MIGLSRPFFQPYLNFSLKDYFDNPELCVRKQLEMKIFLYNEIEDDVVNDEVIGLGFGSALVPSLFGQEAIFRDDTDPEYGKSVIKNKEDLDRLGYPDFYKSGLMPKAHKMYQRMNEIVDGRIPVTFCGWGRSIWGTACQIRGFVPIYMDLVDDPKFVHRLMNFITESRIIWEKERAKFLHTDIRDKYQRWKFIYVNYRSAAPSDLYNDELDSTLMGLKMYKEFVLPYEMKLAEFYGGVRYYHSCGNLTDFFEPISKLPALEMIHVSPWSDLAKAAEVFGKNVILQKSLHPENDLLLCDENEMRQIVKGILTVAEGHKLYICADAIGIGSLEKVKLWVKIARELVQKGT
jgi:uroporphyrinogen-III decarboxylase